MMGSWSALAMLRFILIAFLSISSACAAPAWIALSGTASDFPLAGRGAAAPIAYAEQDAKVVALAAADLAADIERVTGLKPLVHTTPVQGQAVLVGTLGNSPQIDQLVATGKLDVRELKGAWESFIIATVGKQLVIVGSDRRGTAFGVYELSQSIGVSPWYWWADVTPEKKSELYLRAGSRRFGPPSVKYRGIFINDEDWGLQQWAARTLEPENKGIGPKTYARVFELLLRLKANTLWPAMHPGTPAFNSDARNALLANDYAIVMGSSHAEPMLRNNVSEWKAGADAYDYQSNPEGVLSYWDERVAANGKFENVYTIGMRGIHDSAMKGPKAVPDRIALMEKIFADQRGLLARHTGSAADQVPQLFCAYKEVLALYRQGLKVPDDVTIMWPDDNFGYIRSFANASERSRSGGFGVYYHLSYLGAPLSYLSLSTIPPALIWEEMSKAWDAGAQRIWIANVGDIKPAEIGTEFFLQMAWDHKRWTRDTMPGFLAEWAAREFGPKHAAEISAIMHEYYRLNFARKPEHLQWWLPKEAPRHSGMLAADATARQQRFVGLRERAERLRALIAPDKQDAYFELVAYPVTAAALANERFLEGERGNQAAALAAHARLDQLTSQWSNGLANGKWRHMMPQEPGPSEWRSLRASAWVMPQYSAPVAAAPKRTRSIEAERFTANLARGGAAWQTIPGLGRSGEGAVGMFPTTAASVPIEAALHAAPRLEYQLRLPAGKLTLTIHLLPTHSIRGNGVLRLAAGLDGQVPALVTLDVNDGGPDWAQGVLDSRRMVTTTLVVAQPGKHTLQLYGIDPGVIVDRIDIELR
jgi:hypothetical protein